MSIEGAIGGHQATIAGQQATIAGYQALMAKKKKCPYCNADIKSEWKFCPKCGKKLKNM